MAVIAAQKTAFPTVTGGKAARMVAHAVRAMAAAGNPGQVTILPTTPSSTKHPNTP